MKQDVQNDPSAIVGAVVDATFHPVKQFGERTKNAVSRHPLSPLL
jgi:hypothetical protein